MIEKQSKEKIGEETRLSNDGNMVTKEISEGETKSGQGRETMGGRRRGHAESREQVRLERPRWAGKEEAGTQDRSTGYLEGAVPVKTGWRL